MAPIQYLSCKYQDLLMMFLFVDDPVNIYNLYYRYLRLASNNTIYFLLSFEIVIDLMNELTFLFLVVQWKCACKERFERIIR